MAVDSSQVTTVPAFEAPERRAGAEAVGEYWDGKEAASRLRGNNGRFIEEQGMSKMKKKGTSWEMRCGDREDNDAGLCAGAWQLAVLKLDSWQAHVSAQRGCDNSVQTEHMSPQIGRQLRKKKSNECKQYA